MEIQAPQQDSYSYLHKKEKGPGRHQNENSLPRELPPTREESTLLDGEQSQEPQAKVLALLLPHLPEGPAGLR